MLQKPRKYQEDFKRISNAAGRLNAAEKKGLLELVIRMEEVTGDFNKNCLGEGLPWWCSG